MNSELQEKIANLTIQEKFAIMDVLNKDKDFLHAYSRHVMAACDWTTGVIWIILTAQSAEPTTG